MHLGGERWRVWGWLLLRSITSGCWASMAIGGIKGGVSVGQTDELGSAAVEKPFHVRRLHATVLKQLGFDPNELSYFYRGLDQRLVGVEGAEPIHEIIA